MPVRTWPVRGPAAVAVVTTIVIVASPIPTQAASSAEGAWQDASVRSAEPTRNFGDVKEARVTPTTDSFYAKFNTEIPTGATATGLRLCVTPTRSSAGRIQVYDVPGNPYAWNEGGLTWNTQPSPGALLATAGTSAVAGERNCVALPVSARAATDTDLRVASTSGAVFVATSEVSRPARRPVLSVVYSLGEPEPPPPVVDSPLEFTATSPWNVAIPANPLIDVGSAAMVTNLASGANPGIANLYNYGTRVYEANANTPRYRINCTQSWGICPLESEPGGIPIPDGAMGNNGSDRAMTVVDRANGRGYCFWQYGNDKATTSWGGAFNLNSDGSGAPPTGCTGSGLPSLGGPVRVSEMRDGLIPHALVFATRFCQGPDNGANFRFPAGKTDGKYFGTGGVPEGARIQLDPTVNLDAISGITAGERIVAKALQTYGAYAGDCGGANMAFTFEDPKGSADPYPALGFRWDYYGMNHIPWNRVRVLRTWNGR